VSVTLFNGGNSHDMTPDTVVIGGTFRAFSNSSFYQLLKRIEQVGDLAFKCIAISTSIMLKTYVQMTK
jgi:metal-dependent amidase/aminoacylase/carboxypeptidase family protein